MTAMRRWRDLLPIKKLRSLVAGGLIAVAVLSASLTISVTPTAAEAPKAIDLAAYRGKVVYLDFWASWCGPCKLSFPYMRSLRARYQNRDLEIVTINLDRNPALAAAFLSQVGGGLPVVYDREGALARRFSVKDMPTSVLIDRRGNIRFTHRGFHPDRTAEYQQHINQLINEH